jgi:hypothetical protein
MKAMFWAGVLEQLLAFQANMGRILDDIEGLEAEMKAFRLDLRCFTERRLG